jgi:Skp family chaperone for outer membrane proteins
MKKIITILTFFSIIGNAQTAKGIKIAYIDMSYILEKVPDYAEAINQLEQKALKWKQEIETKENEIKNLKENLKTERGLLTKELIEEREEEIAYLEKITLDYQEKKFGPKGDLIIQKSVLVKPIQDQIFTIVQDVAEQRKYDFVFDRSSDLTMLFADRKHDISDFVVRKLTSVQKREEMSAKQFKILEAKEILENAITDSPQTSEREKKLEERKAAREKLLEERKKANEEKKIEAAAKKQKAKEEREAEKNGTIIENNNPEQQKNVKSNSDADKKEVDKETTEEKRKKAAEEKKKKTEERRKILEEKKQKMEADRETAKKEKEEKLIPETQKKE